MILFKRIYRELATGTLHKRINTLSGTYLSGAHAQKGNWIMRNGHAPVGSRTPCSLSFFVPSREERSEDDEDDG